MVLRARCFRLVAATSSRWASRVKRTALRSPRGLSTVSWKTLRRSLSKMEGRVILHFHPSPYSGTRRRTAAVCRA